MFAGEQLLNGLTSVLEQEWPTDALIQIILYADPNMTGIIDRYSCIRNRLLDVSEPREAFLHEWSLWQAGYLRKHCRQGISMDVPVPFRNFRCFLTVKVPCSIRDIRGDSTQAADRLAVVRDNLLGVFRSNQICTQNTRPESLIQVLWQLWNPGHGFLDRNLWDQRRPIREQVIAPDTEITRCRAGVVVDGYRVAVKTPQVYPLSITSVKANLLIGDLFGSNLQQMCSPFALTLQIDPMPADNSLNFKSEITGMQHTAFKALAPRIARKNEEFCWAASQQEQGTKFLRGYLTLVMYDNQPCTDASGTGNCSRNESMAVTVWENQGFRLQNELFAGLDIFGQKLFSAFADGLTDIRLPASLPRIQTSPVRIGGLPYGAAAIHGCVQVCEVFPSVAHFLDDINGESLFAEIHFFPHCLAITAYPVIHDELGERSGQIGGKTSRAVLDEVSAICHGIEHGAH